MWVWGEYWEVWGHRRYGHVCGHVCGMGGYVSVGGYVGRWACVGGWVCGHVCGVRHVWVDVGGICGGRTCRRVMGRW